MYPFASTYIADRFSSHVVIDYDKRIENMKKQEIKNRKEKAKAINKELSTITTKANELFKEAEKNSKARQNEYKIGEQEGSIIIPCIDVTLPIYEGTSNDILDQGVGHLTTSSLPTGGKNTHCVLTGHSGLSNATMFSNLEKMKKNDVFFIKFLDETHKYKVDMINIVKPDEADIYLQTEKTKDLCTLITCTPKTVNTHRLLVRGHRVKYTENDKKKVEKQLSNNISTDNTYIILFIALIALLLLIILILIIRIILKKKRKRKDNNDDGDTETKKVVKQ